MKNNMFFAEISKFKYNSKLFSPSVSFADSSLIRGSQAGYLVILSKTKIFDTLPSALDRESQGRIYSRRKIAGLTEKENVKEYKKENIAFAKELRKNMTPWERKLWYVFLRKYPVRFQRQKAIGNYIVDFYCSKAGIAIELDGGGHFFPEQSEKDAVRTKELKKMGISVLRICNIDIDRNFSGVCEYIDRAVKMSLRQAAVLTDSSSTKAEKTEKL